MPAFGNDLFAGSVKDAFGTVPDRGDMFLSDLGPKARERERERRIREGMSRIDQVFAGFDDTFFNQVRQAQMDFLLPDIRNQFEDARANLTYALARGGQLNSSVAARRQARLEGERQRVYAQADSQAEQAVRRARSDIENERSNLVLQLQSTADPQNAANAAALRADYLRQPQPLVEVGQLFQNTTAGLAAAFRPQYDAYGGRVNSTRGPSFGSQRDNSRVIGG